MAEVFSTDDGFCAGDDVEVDEKETHSRLLGPDGNPIAYPSMPFGFDTRPDLPLRPA